MSSEISSYITPPRTWSGILSYLGPGLIIAGSIVGSGELIATTSTGAAAGFTLLWLILIGCIIKVWVQVELGRYTMMCGQTTMRAINDTPGPAVHWGERRVNWLAVYWLLMFLVSLGQLGGIVAFVGQSIAIVCPLTNHDSQYNALLDERTRLALEIHRLEASSSANDSETKQLLEEKRHRTREIRETLYGNSATKSPPQVKKTLHDEKLWAIGVTVVTCVLLVVGRYKLIEVLTTVLVAGFTFLSVLTVVLLQVQGEYHVSWSQIWQGLQFQLPPAAAGKSSPLEIALSTFGIIGVGANELIQYPYWVQEKGYARFTGQSDGSDAWIERARGWLRVLQYDCWCSMLVYTFATIAFYLLGAGVLAQLKLEPQDNDMIRTLAVMYEPIFGGATAMIFLVGAFAVLYSTFLVANASHARVCADAMRVFLTPHASDEQVRGYVRWFSAIFPAICLVIYLFVENPKALVLASGAMQAAMLPMLAFTAIYFRFTRIDPRLAPGRVWDTCLWLSALGMLIGGGSIAWFKLGALLGW